MRSPRGLAHGLPGKNRQPRRHRFPAAYWACRSPTGAIVRLSPAAWVCGANWLCAACSDRRLPIGARHVNGGHRPRYFLGRRHPRQPNAARARHGHTGIFSHVRNPMYEGGTLMLIGIALLVGSDWILILLVPALLLVHFGVVLREERYLSTKFGEAYCRYLHEVPRYGWKL